MKIRRETPITLHFYCKQEKKKTNFYIEKNFVLLLNVILKPTKQLYTILHENNKRNIYIFVKIITLDG